MIYAIYKVTLEKSDMSGGLNYEFEAEFDNRADAEKMVKTLKETSYDPDCYEIWTMGNKPANSI